MTVKAKFRCNQVVDTDNGNGFKNRVVKFTAVYGTEGENASYSKATPWGELNMQIDEGTDAYDAFQPGKNYCLAFEEAEK